MTPTPLRFVRVVWEDISVVDDSTWVFKEGLKKPDVMIFDSVGWLLELDHTHIVISGCMGKDLMGPRERIPIGVVKSITEFDQSAGRAVPIPKKRRTKKTA